ncbi:hypothetical protein BURMUCGD1_3590 [Burkholderia multivorans CGD1]|nr:hypothetical protein BURMUCGD1_3590 [Burkholderia multivorans CGD1]
MRQRTAAPRPPRAARRTLRAARKSSDCSTLPVTSRDREPD